MNDTIKNLRAFLEAARLAVSMAKIENPTARGMAGVGYKLPDGSGKLVCDFDSEPFCDDLEKALDHIQTLETKSTAAYNLGGEAMRAACRDIADEHREAIDAVALSYSAPDTDWRDRPPTLDEVKALAQTVECNVWSGQTQWMILQPTDQTVMVQIVTITERNYAADIKYAMDQGACSFRPVTIDGDRYPWPVIG